MTEDYNHKFRIVISGADKAGKTSLTDKFCKNIFDPFCTRTDEIDFADRIIQLDGKNIKIHCWDTAGSLWYTAATYQYFLNILGVIIMFDLTDDRSYDEVLFHLNKTKRYIGNAKIILVGNKCDLIEDRVITYETAKEFANWNNLPYFEVSCKASEQVEYVFVSLASMILSERMQALIESISIQHCSPTPTPTPSPSPTPSPIPIPISSPTPSPSPSPTPGSDRKKWCSKCCIM